MEDIKDDLADPAHPAELQWRCGDTDTVFRMTINLSKVISFLMMMMMMWSIFYLQPPSIRQPFFSLPRLPLHWKILKHVLAEPLLNSALW